MRDSGLLLRIPFRSTPPLAPGGRPSSQEHDGSRAPKFYGKVTLNKLPNLENPFGAKEVFQRVGL